jgi:hypothetical protein
MKFLKIQNKGLLDIRLIALMGGGTTKSGNSYAIGRFGTGLKYTLAFLFRNNLAFKIFVGQEEIKINTEIEQIGDTTFEIICINGHRTSITTQMGQEWRPWMICRELYCNALDEGEASHEVTTNAVGTEGKTTFYIQVDTQIQDVINNWDKYFIQNKTPMFVNDNCRIYPGGDSLRLYKNGVLILEDGKTRSLFAYDLLEAEINELREFKGSKSYTVAKCLAQADRKVASYFLENIKDSYYEGSHEMDFEWYLTFNPAWGEVIGQAKLITQKSLDDIRARGIEMDGKDYIIVPKNVYKTLTKQFEGVGALRVAQKGAEFFEHYDPIVENRVKEALTVLEHCDYIFHPDLEFVFGYFEDRNVGARINLDEKKVYISNTFLSKSVFEICYILAEENEHFLTGFHDCSRELQTHFLKLWMQRLLKEHEVEL